MEDIQAPWIGYCKEDYEDQIDELDEYENPFLDALIEEMRDNNE